ncbi:PQQ-dependent sugar dehydrogenase [Pontibacter kalidii]|uniref:PQQ-dependent sugar dehydrogenase n=1 Tax=Pontibacter kalidii TaxID=2592049 RepID=UPI00224F500B|nr:PQQ-dependent sugar dehydrogenase [Pontibacter kalidii]
MKTQQTVKIFVTMLTVFLSVFTFSCRDDDEGIPLPGNEDTINLDLIGEGFTSPVYLTQAPGDNQRLFVVDQIGVIRIIEDGRVVDQPFLDLQDKIVPLNPNYDERGLLGLAFHPDYTSNGKFYVYYSGPLRPEAPEGWNHTSYIAEYQASYGNPARADESSERIVLAVDQPQSNHNAGTLKFGPDNYLYISIGDGGGANDTAMGHVEDWYEVNKGGNGQDVKENLLGNILRIDVNGGDPYGIPADNPFAGDKEGLDEIYAYGFRNPYRFSFDRLTGMLIAADAGQELYEEVDVVTKGGNYGWNVKEGRHCFNAADPLNPLPDCPDVDSAGNPLIDPVIEFGNSENLPNGLGIVGVGGYVYRGLDNAWGLAGSYIFGVFAKDASVPSGAIYAANTLTSRNNWNYRKLTIANSPNKELGHYLLGFGEDNAGELYVLTRDELGPQGNTGKVYRID